MIFVTKFNFNVCVFRISEQRRKRVQELEAQIGDLKKKQKEQLKLIRMKEQSEQKVNKLSSEIQVS